MKIGLLIAIERELKSFINYGSDIKEIKHGNKIIYKTDICGHEIYAIQSGYGIIDASSATQFLITKFDCKIILNFGVTGALDRNLKVDDLFVVKKVLNYDFDVSPIDPVKKHQYVEFEDEFIPLDNDLITLAKKAYPSLMEAVVASGGKFIEEKSDKIDLYNQGCNICDMEIAAIARVCALENVKCLSIKCISDTFDGNGGDFNTNVINSANKSFNVIIEILKHL